MGNCFGNDEKEKDPAPRTRAPVVKTNTTDTKPVEKTQNSNTGSMVIGKSPDEGDFRPGQSPIDEHYRQQDLLRSIVQKTTKNFIHVTSSQAPLEKATVQKRHSHYIAKLKGVNVKTNDGKLGLTPPVPSVSNAHSLKQILTFKPNPVDDLSRQFARNIAQSLHEGMVIKDVGQPLVVTF